MRTLFGLIFVSLAIAGCGDDQNNGSGDNNGANGNTGDGGCSLTLPLSGAVEESLDWGSSEGCAGASSGGLVTLTFGAFGDSSVVMGLSDATAGETGSVGTYVRYTNADDAEWTAQDCTLELTTNEVSETDPDFGDTYLLAGTGSCNEAATATAGDADGEVTIGDFEFSNDRVPGWGE